jgi:hypothetical protein
MGMKRKGRGGCMTVPGSEEEERVSLGTIYA